MSLFPEKTPPPRAGKFLVLLALLLATLATPTTTRAAVPEARHVDVVLLYTRDARDVYGSEDGVRAAAIYMFTSANRAYENSGVSARLRLVGIKATNYIESEYYGDDLMTLSAMEEVEDQPGWIFSIDEPERQPALFLEAQAFREQRNADLVCLLRQGTDANFTAGIAWVLDEQFDEPSGEFERIAFSVVGIDYIGIQAFAHELGHNLGCAHDRYTAGTHTPQTKDWTQGRFPYSYGYKPDSGLNSWGTIMSYTNNRVLYYSSPNVFYNGYATGIAKNQNYSADNVSSLNYTIPLTAAYYALPASTVSFSPAPGGSHEGSVTVAITTTRPNSTLRYTTDGSTVSEDSPLYTVPLTLTQNTTLTARAFRAEDGTPAEKPATAAYVFALPAPVISPAGGAFITSLTVSMSASSGTVIHYTLDGSDVSEGSPTYFAPFVLHQTTTVRARAYRNGYTPSPQVTAVFDKGIPTHALPPVFITPGGSYANGVSVALEAPADGAVLRYTLDDSPVSATSPAYSGPFPLDQTTTVRVRAFRDGIEPSDEIAATYTILLPAPVFTPANGTIFNGNITVTLATAANTTVHYTLDGSAPTEASPAYVLPFLLYQSTTVRARAFRDGCTPSDEVSATYTKDLDLADPPAFATPGGDYTDSVTIAFAPPTPGATIRYTLDGSTPTASSPAYSDPFVLARSATVRARAFQNDLSPSTEISATYTIHLTPPAIAPGGGTYAGSVNVALTAASGTTIRYTLSSPYTTSRPDSVSEASTRYTSSIILVSSCILTARAYRDGCEPSDPATATFTLTVAPQAAAPVISPNGGTFTAPVTITLSSATPGASLRYTLDGSEVSPVSNAYTAPFVLRQDATIRTRAYHSGYRPSNESRAAFSVADDSASTEAPAAPTITPNGGEYYASTTVVLRGNTPGATIRYTLDGSEVTPASPAYTVPIVLHGAIGTTTIVRARAYAGTRPPGEESTAAFFETTRAPEILQQPAARTANPGDSVSFAVIARATPAPRYQWRRNGTPLSGATLATLSLARVTAANAGAYDVVVTNAGGSVTSAPATLTIRDPNAPPQIQVQPVAPSGGVTVGEPVSFRVEALDPNGGALTLQWYFNGTPISGANTAEYTIPATALRHAGSYTVTLTAANGRTTTSVAAILIVHPETVVPGGPDDPEPPTTPSIEKPVIVEIRSTAQTPLPPKSPLALLFELIRGGRVPDCEVATGHGVILEADVREGGEVCTYVWLRNGVPVSGVPSLPSYVPTATENGETWALRVSNSAGVATSRAVVLEVVAPPVIIRAPELVEAGAGAPGVLRVEATGEPQLYYQWFRDGVPLPFAVLGACEVRGPGLYRVVVSNRGGEVSAELLVP